MLPTTLILLQVGLDVETSAVGSLKFCSGRRICLAFVVNLKFIFSIGQRFRTGRYKISHLQQYLIVGCNFKSLLRKTLNGYKNAYREL